jgi:hypothetical protein
MRLNAWATLAGLLTLTAATEPAAYVPGGLNMRFETSSMFWRTIMYRAFLGALVAICIANRADGVSLLDVNFNDGVIPTLGVIQDELSGVNVEPSAGNLSDMPLVLTGTANGLASVVFVFPQLSEGRYLFSWDSLVLSAQPEDKDVFGRDQSFVHLLGIEDNVGFVEVPWSLEYDASGQMLLGCCNSSVPVSSASIGAYVPGQSDHFELAVDLDSDTYRLRLNGALKVASSPLLAGFVNGIAFSSPGRFFTKDPAALAVDNIKVEVVPEPSTILTLGGGILGLASTRRRKTSAMNGMQTSTSQRHKPCWRRPIDLRR